VVVLFIGGKSEAMGDDRRGRRGAGACKCVSRIRNQLIRENFC
jgi:hypothetical protein